MEKLSDISIVILNYNTYQLTINAIEDIRDLSMDINIVVVDNCSPNDSWIKLNEYLNQNELQNVFLVKSEKNTGYACGNNFGIKYVRENIKSKYIVIMNPDIKVRNVDMFNQMINVLSSNDDVGAVTVQTIFNGKVNYPNDCCWKFSNRRQLLFNNSIIGRFLKISDLYKSHSINNNFAYVDVVQGCFFMIKSSTMELINDFDSNTFLYVEEAILAKRLQKQGYKNALLPEFFIEHNHHVKNKSLEKYKSRIFHTKCYYKSKKYYIKHYSGYGFLFKFFSRISLSMEYFIKKIILRIILK